MGSLIKPFCLFLVLFVISSLQLCVDGVPKVPCYFVFGDSLVDSGYNNMLKTSAKANYPPYGDDFPGGPTGRFTNGKTEADIIAELLGFEQPIKPFGAAKGQEILRGVNYASGFSGLLEETGSQLGEHVSLMKQVHNHQTTIARLTKILGNSAAVKDHLGKCLYTFDIGYHDFVDNILFPKYYNKTEFLDTVMSNLISRIQDVYNLGGRKAAVFGLRPVGCSPYVMSKQGKKGACVEEANKAIEEFNDSLFYNMDSFNAFLGLAKFMAVNTTGILSSNNLSGFKVTNATCCPVSDNGLCSEGKAACPNRNDYMYFDGLHTTEAVNKLIAERAFNAPQPTDTYPYSIRALVE